MKSLLLKNGSQNRSQNSVRRVAGYAKFGTYGFLSMLLATQMAATPSLFAAKDEAAFQKRKAERND